MDTDAESAAVLRRAAEGEWRSMGIGISMKVLRSDKSTGASSILLKFDAGASFPVHNHPGGEEVYVVEGDVQLGDDALQAGDYLYTSPGGRHSASSRNGCVMLVITPKGIEVGNSEH